VTDQLQLGAEPDPPPPDVVAPEDEWVPPHIEAIARELYEADAAKYHLARKPWVWPRVRKTYVKLARAKDLEDDPIPF